MVEIHELEQMTQRLEDASHTLRSFAGEVLKEAGEEFLDIVQEEIMRAGNVDTRLLLSSFSKGSSNNIYQLDLGGLTLTVGTRVEYARWVNEGHTQTPGRFIPGVWQGNKFQYLPGANTGIVLKAARVMGSGFFEKSIETFQRVFPEVAETKIQAFLDRYF